MKLNISIILLLLILSACSGGTIGGLFPAPKILNGKLDGLKYTSPDGIFSVVAPVSKERGEWLYTKIKEHSEQHEDQNSRYVGFKTPYDSHFYSVEVINYLNKNGLTREPFFMVKKNNLLRLIKSTEERWKTKVSKLNDNTIKCENNDTFSYSILKQHIDSDNINFDKYYLISQSFKNNSITIVISELNFDKRINNIPEKEITNMNYSKHRELVCSVELHV